MSEILESLRMQGEYVEEHLYPFPQVETQPAGSR